MKSTILSQFENLPYFTFEGFRQLADEYLSDASHARIALNRWVKAGHLIRLKKGVYMHRAFYERHRREPEFSPVISSILEPLSYLSLEYVLQSHGVITEITYPISAITTKNKHTIINSLGIFEYRHILEPLFKGYKISQAFGVTFSQASKAKALFDFLYLRPQSAGLNSPVYDYANDLRLNLDAYSAQERVEFKEYVIDCGKLKMNRILDNFEKHVWQH